MTPKISVIIPLYEGMKGGAEFLWRSINMLTRQTFQDFEIIITQEGKMAENTNAGIKRAKGELIKILFLDDMLSSAFALQDIVEAFTPDVNWLITGTHNNPEPYWTDDIETGNNKLGSPSALTFRNQSYFGYDFQWVQGDNLLFDENMSWLLDCDYYKRMHERYGPPKILPGNRVILGIGDHQMTNILTNEEKLSEFKYLNQKYAKNK